METTTMSDTQTETSQKSQRLRWRERQAAATRAAAGPDVTPPGAAADGASMTNERARELLEELDKRANVIATGLPPVPLEPRAEADDPYEQAKAFAVKRNNHGRPGPRNK